MQSQFFKLPGGAAGLAYAGQVLPTNATPCTEDEFVDAVTAQVLTLAQAQAAQVATLQASYAAAVSAPVTFKSAAGVTSTYPSGNTALPNGMTAREMITTILSAGAAGWTLGKWLDTNDVAQTFTFADIQGLAAAMEAAGTADWTELVSLIAQVQAITESTPNAVTAVQAIVWPATTGT